MSAIKAKIGNCKEDGCGYNGPLLGGYCQSHYWADRASKKKAKAEERQEEPSQSHDKYFASQALAMPLLCEETQQVLPRHPKWLMLSCCAHILPKRKGFGGFPSVAEHPANMIYLHPDIHNKMDNFGADYIVTMKSLPIMKARVQSFIHLLTEKERNRVPKYFL